MTPVLLDDRVPLVHRVHQVCLDLRVLMGNQESKEKRESPDTPVFPRSRSARETKESRASRDHPEYEAFLARTASQDFQARRARSVSPDTMVRRALLEDPAPKDTLATPEPLDLMEHPLQTFTQDQKETKAIQGHLVSPVSRDSRVKQETQDQMDQMDRPATQGSLRLASRANKETQE